MSVHDQQFTKPTIGWQKEREFTWGHCGFAHHNELTDFRPEKVLAVLLMEDI